MNQQPIDFDTMGIASIDTIVGKGSEQEALAFLPRALEAIVYRASQLGLWSDDNDVRLFIPANHPEIFNSEFVDIGGVKVKVVPIAPPGQYSIIIMRLGNNELAKWDTVTGRYLIMARWATAVYIVTQPQAVNGCACGGCCCGSDVT